MERKTIFALGFFDGVHLGHQALLTACKKLAEEAGCAAGVVTFASHPDALVSGQAPALINTSADRCNLLNAYGIKTVIELPFDQALMKTHWAQFLRWLVSGGAAGFVCGSDFRFGAGGLGTAKKLEAFCKKQELSCAIVPQLLLEDIRVSSTYIRGLLEAGEAERSMKFLGHPHILSGQVVAGRQLGRTIGIPTANLELPAGVICPKHGVYACRVVVDDKQYLAVTNVGSRPTVDDGNALTVESFLLDFSGDLYDKSVRVEFYKFLRPEEKFPDLDALRTEIMRNVAQTRTYFRFADL